jgi:hypothetical protein
VTLHVPPRGKHLVRRYGLYSSRGRGTWKSHVALSSRAPASWYGRNATADPASSDTPMDREVDALCRRRAWARLLAKVHAIDVLACPRCGSRMSVIAVITEPAQIRRIIDCLEHHGRGPPPVGSSCGINSRSAPRRTSPSSDSHGSSTPISPRPGFVRVQIAFHEGDHVADRDDSSATSLP